MNGPLCTVLTSEGPARPGENARRQESDRMASAPDALTHVAFLMTICVLFLVEGVGLETSRCNNDVKKGADVHALKDRI